MKKLTGVLSLAVVMGLAVAACSGTDNQTGQNGANESMAESTVVFDDGAERPGFDSTVEPDITAELPDTGALATVSPDLTDTTNEQDAAVTASPEATQSMNATEATDANVTATPIPGSEATSEALTPVQFAARIQPEADRIQATRLSGYAGYQVIDQNGEAIGSLNDTIINLCEAHVVYMVIDADASLGLQNGNRLVIPFEMVTLNDGVIDVSQKTIQVNVDGEMVRNAPTVGDELTMNSTEWEGDIQGYWGQNTNLSLSSACTVPGSNDEGPITVNKILYGSELINAGLQTGNGQDLGTVEDVVIEPESGQLMFVVVRLEDGLVPLPVRALNIDREGNGGTQNPPLILLVDQSILDNAPRIDSLPSMGQDDWLGGAREYWSQHVQMQGLP